MSYNLAWALTALRHKMANYQAHGFQLGWLLIPQQQAVEIWPGAGQGKPQSSADASPLFPGLEIGLQEVWCV